ncbi:Phenylpropionate dioxygenase, large terminal subunit [Enhydrobacter aerosaccus]|uniref:Phenylpropionate dioxygenase, large terminal subunit n=1 Tax=Enhydrobacter aerosaccus TaxID=225324 RepID=A0A1T4T584_9HYPH|nr:SRPBCC family protein [Enhydrobacter aerosaccus]SKA35674.1 Phenylpropionate dioxygenase, large terminal subunit [Enhydrobacter aerosaccus]
MDRKEELAVGRRLLGHIDCRTTDLAADMFRNQTIAYACRDRAALEREKLFRERPLLMGLSSRLAKPGDYLTEDVVGMPVLLVRDGTGSVQAFANVCRHRGAPVAQGCGNARAFTCPYHGWTYDLAGRLLGATDKPGFAGLDIAAHGLVPLPTVEKHGMIYVRPGVPRPGESRTIDIDAELGVFAPPLAALQLDDFVLHSTDRIAPRINWKFAVDTFLESYHIAHLHRKTIAPYFVGNCCVFDSGGLHGRASFVKNSIDKTRAEPEDERRYLPHIVQIYQLFPNSLLVWQMDHIEIWRTFPKQGDPGVCEVELTLYKPVETTKPDSYWEKNRDIAIRTVLDEDFPLGERMQIGFESGATEEVVYGRNEPALVHFHRSIRQALGVAA